MIAFLDSGVGGLPYLALAKQKMPDGSYIYLADRKNFPYGDKSPKELTPIVLKNIKLLQSLGKLQALVIACNTASVSTLEAARTSVDFPIVGVVPAVKPAANSSTLGKIGVLATQGTISAIYLERLITSFAGHCQVEKVVGADIVNFIENDFFTSSQKQKEAVLTQAASLFQKAGVDSVVLGCTHFIFLYDQLQKVLGPQVKIIDSREGVIRQLMRVTHYQHKKNSKAGKACLYHSGNKENDPLYTQFADFFQIDFCGRLAP